MIAVKGKAAAAVLTLLLLLATACKSPAEAESPASPPESSSPPPESLEYEQEHDHTGIPGLNLPESLPVGDYAFEAYDSSAVQVASMDVTLDGVPADIIVLTVPRNTGNFVECYADGVLVCFYRLEEEAGSYTSVPLGCLTGDDQWTPEEIPMSSGDRYDLTFGEAGFFRLEVTDSSGLTDTYFFLVSE